METMFFKVTSYVEVFVPHAGTQSLIENARKLAVQKIRNDDDMYRDNIGLSLEELDDPFEQMSGSFNQAVVLFEEFDLEACRKWYEKARFNVEVGDDD